MKVFIAYLKEYFANISLKGLALIVLFVIGLVWCNYSFGIESRIRDLHPWPFSLLSFFFLYGFVIFLTWGIQYSCYPGLQAAITSPAASDRPRFFLLLLLAPLFFSFKMIHWDLAPLFPGSLRYPWNRYTQIVLQLPLKLMLLFVLLYICRGMGRSSGEAGAYIKMRHIGLLSFFGLTTRNFRSRPYFAIVLFLIPLIILASTQHDFLCTYPKVKSIAFISSYTYPVWPWQLLYEISYGLDFLSIELFFRGLLVIGLARYGGQYVILPMAVFYCTIHFGKPLGECISSFFGGLALGVIAFRTRSLLGGLIVHLGLAWMMEVGGWLGHLYL